MLQLCSKNHPLQSNLAVALYFLPLSYRRDALYFYRFCRSIDDCVDHAALSRQEKELFLQQALNSMEELIERRELRRKLFLEIIDGMRMDFTIARYATFEELCTYIWRVAAAVGLVSAELFGARGLLVEQYAHDLAIALQLTNMLRDVAEDAKRGRIYLPLEDLKRFGVYEEEILTALPSPRVTHLFEYQAERALSFFAKAHATWEKMLPHQQYLLRPARFMETIYRALLEKMEKDRYDVFYKKYRVDVMKKILVALEIF